MGNKSQLLNHDELSKISEDVGRENIEFEWY
jgi:hypothetical protein